MRLSLSLLLVSLSGFSGSLVAQTLNHDRACLYSTKVGGKSIQATPCRSVDALSFAKDANLSAVIRAFGIRPESIVFAGCDGGVFSTAVAQFNGSFHAANRYLITYPSGSKNGFLAPITHELAHVVQIEMAGGLERLQNSLESKRIELGADFLTGIVFSHALNQAGLGEFQTNLSLMGLYRDPSTGAHGTPNQRTAAFRRGVFFPFKDVGENFERASQEFQENIYGESINIP